jgi:hypothetical protein
MSLDKSIAHGKEHRKPYRGSKAIDPSCRNHGGCPWCEENRKHKFRDKGGDTDSWIYPDDYTRTAAEEAEDRTAPAADDHSG